PATSRRRQVAGAPAAKLAAVLRRAAQPAITCAAMKRIFALAVLLFATTAFAENPLYAPDRRADEGEGPFQRLIIRGATVVDGTGAPPVGPVDIVIEGNRPREILTVGFPKPPIR